MKIINSVCSRTVIQVSSKPCGPVNLTSLTELDMASHPPIRFHINHLVVDCGLSKQLITQAYAKAVLVSKFLIQQGVLDPQSHHIVMVTVSQIFANLAWLGGFNRDIDLKADPSGEGIVKVGQRKHPNLGDVTL